MSVTDIQTLRAIFERALSDRIRYTMTPLPLLEAMVYSLQNGGKRLRPTLLLMVLAIQSADSIKQGLQTAMALEFIHTYSLIHDDLPAMDDDDLRRGQLTNHRKFNEATAILAGDALLTDAFGLITHDELLNDAIKVQVVGLLSKAAGSLGMVIGQFLDMEAENGALSLEQLRHIHSLKTGELFTFAVEAGAVIAGVADWEKAMLVKFSKHFGRAYQIHNDLMEVIASPMETGKENQSDQSHNKSTYPQLLGIEGTKMELQKELQEAEVCLDKLQQKTTKPYRELATFLVYLGV